MLFPNRSCMAAIGCAITLLALTASPSFAVPPDESVMARLRPPPPESAAMKEVRQIEHQVVKDKSVSPAQMARLRILVNDESPFVRARALTALWSAESGKPSQDADAIARGKLTDKEWLVRVYALSTLTRLKAPDLVAQARKLLKDPDPHVRERAAGILKAQR